MLHVLWAPLPSAEEIADGEIEKGLPAIAVTLFKDAEFGPERKLSLSGKSVWKKIT